jgi:hypothetical protein
VVNFDLDKVGKQAVQQVITVDTSDAAPDYELKLTLHVTFVRT